MLNRLAHVFILLGLAVGLVVSGPTAGAATGTHPAGRVSKATQSTFTHAVTVRGAAFDPAAPATSLTVGIVIDGVRRARIMANHPSPDYNALHKIRGKHGFAARLSWPGRATTVSVVLHWAHSSRRTALPSVHPFHFTPPPGLRIVRTAQRNVGSPYLEGGASPRGFDCSGYTEYVYARAGVRALPHNAELQRRSAGMKIIARSRARPGDLIFYLSGGRAYHVAIYAGKGMQYSAATPRDGVRYQHVWSSAVRYGTDWH